MIASFFSSWLIDSETETFVWSIFRAGNKLKKGWTLEDLVQVEHLTTRDNAEKSACKKGENKKVAFNEIFCLISGKKKYNSADGNTDLTDC